MSNTTINNAALDIFGNLTGVNANVTTLRATGQINAVGNVVAPFFIGNGSLLTGVTATVPTGPLFSMYRTGNLTFTTATSATGSNITYDGITFDPLSVCNVTTGSFTVPQSGYYQFSTSTTFPIIVGSGTIEIRLVKNTTQPIAILSGIFAFADTQVARTTFPGSALVNLTVGDIINVRLFNQMTSGNVTVFGNSSNIFTRFYGDYAGA